MMTDEEHQKPDEHNGAQRECRGKDETLASLYRLRQEPHARPISLTQIMRQLASAEPQCFVIYQLEPLLIHLLVAEGMLKRFKAGLERELVCLPLTLPGEPFKDR